MKTVIGSSRSSHIKSVASSDKKMMMDNKKKNMGDSSSSSSTPVPGLTRSSIGSTTSTNTDGSSPTSIVTVSLTSTPPLHHHRKIIRSVIAVCEDGGAEVTLAAATPTTTTATTSITSSSSTPPLVARTPTTHQQQHHHHPSFMSSIRRGPPRAQQQQQQPNTMAALLDSEISPSPLKKQLQKQRSTPSSSSSSASTADGSPVSILGGNGENIVWNVTTSPDDASPQCCMGITVAGSECYEEVGGIGDGMNLKINAPHLLSAQEMQDTISNLLGSPVKAASFLQGWQAWSYYNMEQSPTSHDETTTSKNHQQSASADVEELQNNIRRSLRNRAIDMQKRKERLNALRRDLSPFNATPPHHLAGNSKSMNIAGEGYHRPRSFSTVVSENAKTNKRRPRNGNSSSNTATNNSSGNNNLTFQYVTPEKEEQDLSSSLWGCGMNCVLQDCGDNNTNNNKNSSPIQSLSFRRMGSLLADDDDCYDSDPEEFATTRSARRGNNNINDDSNTTCTPDSKNTHTYSRNNSPPKTPTQHTAADKENARPPSAPRRIGTAGRSSKTNNSNRKASRKSRRGSGNTTAANTSNNDYEVKMTVQDLMNERNMTLILHQNSHNSNSKALRPRGVRCWIERGQNLKNSVLPPRICWTPIHPTTAVTAKMASTIRRRMFFQKEETNSIALLDVHRILEVEKIDRMAHPFARSNSTFIIKTLDRTVMFEACSGPERDRIVKSLKMVVARLGSMLLLRDDALVDEFFAGGEMEQGPGEEPYWLNDTV